MSEANDPKIREFENAGWHDNMQGRQSQYASLKAAENPYAEHYLRGWNHVEAMAEDFRKNGFGNAA